MKHKILITGKSESVIDDFFIQMNDNFEVLTTSTRYEDIIRHLNYFSPDVFVYCISRESRDSINQMINVKYRLSQAAIPFVIIGTNDDCDEFTKIAVNVANLVLVRPLSFGAFQARISKLADDFEVVRNISSKDEARKTNISDTERFFQTMPSSFSQTAQRKHVLVVDDNSIMLKLIKEYLHERYDVATAVSGKVALKFLERRKTDLILLDYEMPEENGPAVLERLRASDATKNIPVVFLTGVTESKKIQEALILKPQSYLLKPIDKEKLLEVITKIID